MSSNDSKEVTAERQFRAAFERLKTHAPINVDASAPLSQNNVAKEAGKDPSALRKSRYPSLVAEIQRWVTEHVTDTPPSPRQRMMSQRRRNRSLREQITAIKEQRDIALSQFLAMKTQILDLTAQIADLDRTQQPSNVSSFPAKASAPKS